jgi:exodeoxyribonuclease-5
MTGAKTIATALDVAWSSQQLAAIEQFGNWLDNPRGRQIFRIDGYAGTGKTTMARKAGLMVASASGLALFCAYTGKAAAVLRSKGCCDARTLHQLLYRPAERSRGGRRRDEIVVRVKSIADPGLGCGTLKEQIAFDLNDKSEVADADLIVVDEATMVDREIADDLLSFGRRILVLQDPAQLAPPAGRGALITGEPDVFLTEIHRQAESNPIIGLSMRARQQQEIACGEYGDSVVVRGGPEAALSLADGADQILCGTNKTRVAFNRALRAKYGRRDWLPERGDRLVCLENRHRRGLLNGTIWTVLDAWKGRAQASRVDVVVLTLVEEDTGQVVEATVPALSFAGRGDEIPKHLRRGFDLFDFGYALTVHKAQGSEWPEVVLLDESRFFREHRWRHQYTAITRASQRLIMVVA